MPKLEYNYNTDDYQLIATENNVSNLNNLPLYTYFRLIVFKDNEIFELAEGGLSGKAIFYSSTSTSSDNFEINVSPFTDNTSILTDVKILWKL